jgi:hypothetical protein
MAPSTGCCGRYATWDQVKVLNASIERQSLLSSGEQTKKDRIETTS